MPGTIWYCDFGKERVANKQYYALKQFLSNEENSGIGSISFPAEDGMQQ